MIRTGVWWFLDFPMDQKDLAVECDLSHRDTDKRSSLSASTGAEGAGTTDAPLSRIPPSPALSASRRDADTSWEATTTGGRCRRNSNGCAPHAQPLAWPPAPLLARLHLGDVAQREEETMQPAAGCTLYTQVLSCTTVRGTQTYRSKRLTAAQAAPPVDPILVHGRRTVGVQCKGRFQCCKAVTVARDDDGTRSCACGRR